MITTLQLMKPRRRLRDEPTRSTMDDMESCDVDDEHSTLVDAPAPCPPIVWEPTRTVTGATIEPPLTWSYGPTEAPAHARFTTLDLPAMTSIRRFANRWSALLSRPSFLQLHGRSPMETSRIAATSVADAADVLTRSKDVEWGSGRNAGHLRLGPFKVMPEELGRPRISDGVLYGHGFRRLSVTIAIYRYGNERCSIQIRPRYRRPRGSRRLRHYLRSTHDAADRLREIALTIDFTPPRHTTDAAA